MGFGTRLFRQPLVYGSAAALPLALCRTESTTDATVCASVRGLQTELAIMSRRCSSKNFDRTVRMRACERKKQAKAAPLSNTYLNYSSTVVFEGPQG